MYKSIAVVLLVVVYSASAVPVDQQGELVDGPSDYQYGVEPEHYVRADRIARATCDLLSVEIGGVSLNHSACAAHCLVLNKGFRGGRCIDGVCHCRK